MNFEIIKKSFEGTEDEKIKEDLLQMIVDDIKKSKAFPFPNIKSFGDFLNESSSYASISQKIIIVDILKVLMDFDSYEFEQIIPIIFDIYLKFLVDPSNELRKSIKEIYQNSWKKNRNTSLYIELILQKGLKNANHLIRNESIKLLKYLFSSDSKIFLSKLTIPRVIQAISELVSRLSDNSQEVANRSEKLLYQIRKEGSEGFYEVFMRLDVRIQEKFNKIFDKYKKKLEIEKPQDFTELLREVSELESVEIDYDSIFKSFFDLEIPEEREEQLEFFAQNENNLYFGFLHISVLTECLYLEDPVIQLKGIGDLLKEFHKVKEEFPKFQPYLQSLFKFLVFLLRSENTRIVSSCLSLLESLINIPGLEQRLYLPLLLPVLFEKFGNERVFLRKRISLIVKRLILQVSKPTLLRFFVQRLSSANWHIREETLFLSCHLLLHVHSTIGTNNFNIKLEWVCEEFAKKLDDNVKKVREAALEVLGILYTKFQCQDILHNLLIGDVYDYLTDKVEKNDIFFLNEFGELEKPVHYEYAFEIVKDPDFLQENALDTEETREELANNKSAFLFARQDKEARNMRNDYYQDILLSKEGIQEVPEGFGEYLTAHDFEITDPSKVKGRRNSREVVSNGRKEKEILKFVQQPTYQLEYKTDPRFKVKPETQTLSTLFNVPFRIVKSLNAENNKVELLSKSIHHNTESYKGYKYEEDSLDIQLKKAFAVEMEKPKPETPEIIGKTLNGHQLMENFLDHEENIRSNKTKKEKAPAQWDFGTEPPHQSSLQKLKDPEVKARTIMLELKSSELKRRVVACSNLRSLLLHHSEFLYEQPFTFSEIAKDLAVALEKAEAAFSRAILVSLAEMGQLLKKNLDEAVFTIIHCCLEKFRQKGFYHDEIKRVLISIGRNTSPTKVLEETLKSFHTPGNEEFYSFICLLLEQIVISKGSTIKSYNDIPLFFPVILKIINYNVYWPRRAAKKLLYKIFLTGISKSELESMMANSLSFKECQVILKWWRVKEKLCTENLNTMKNNY